MQTYSDVLFEVVDGTTALITINRPDRYNAFRVKTVEELIDAFKRAWADAAVRYVILTGAGDKAFCTGGDVKQRAETGDYGPTSNGLFEIEYLQRVIREIPKPVIAAVNGLAVGGGYVLQVLCDLTIASETARFEQAGPKVGSFDAGFGTAYLAHIVGGEAGPEDLVPVQALPGVGGGHVGVGQQGRLPEQLLEEARSWAREIAEKAPTAIKFLKASFNADTEHQAGLSLMANAGLKVYVESDEAREGAAAFAEKRPADFSTYAVVVTHASSRQRAPVDGNRDRRRSGAGQVNNAGVLRDNLVFRIHRRLGHRAGGAPQGGLPV